MNKDFLMHYGIKGQKWGVKNGPPYPLKGVSVRKNRYHLTKAGEENKTIKKGSITQTLSYDKNRIKDTDMYFASLTNRDKNFYKTFFNKKMPNDAFDENGK